MKKLHNILQQSLFLLVLVVALMLARHTDFAQADASLFPISQEEGFSANSYMGDVPAFTFVCDDDHNQDDKRKYVKFLVHKRCTLCTSMYTSYEVEVCGVYIQHRNMFFSGSSPPTA